MTRRNLVLVHSPLCGPGTWSALTPILEQRGWTVFVPDLHDDGEPPYYRQHVESIVAQTGSAYDAVFVGHSGAGALLP